MTEPTREQLQQQGAEHQAMRLALLPVLEALKRMARVAEPHAGKRKRLFKISTAIR